MKKTKTYITNSFEETQAIGQKLAEKLAGGVIALYGNLGGGKTTFTQGLAKGLGITRRIISPTFVIVKRYTLSKYSSSAAKRSREDSSRQARTINFYHIDLYRTESQKDLEGLGIEEIIKDPKNIVVIEWAEKLGFLLPKKRIDVKFEYITETKRKIVIYE